MKSTIQKNSLKGLQANRQLKEWNDNLAWEIKARYALTAQHKKELSYLFFAGGNEQQRVELAARQTQEIQASKRQNEATRTALRQRHLQEKTDWPDDDQLDQKISAIFKWHSGQTASRK